MVRVHAMVHVRTNQVEVNTDVTVEKDIMHALVRATKMRPIQVQQLSDI
jgi:hypothetical protein